MLDVAALEPARLIDLSETTGIPRATVQRLLKQLIEVGAVQRDGTRNRLGASLLGLGALVSPSGDYESPPVDRWPNRVATGAAVSLSARSAARWCSGHRRCSCSAWILPAGRPGSGGNGAGAGPRRIGRLSPLWTRRSAA